MEVWIDEETSPAGPVLATGEGTAFFFAGGTMSRPPASLHEWERGASGSILYQHPVTAFCTRCLKQGTSHTKPQGTLVEPSV